MPYNNSLIKKILHQSKNRGIIETTLILDKFINHCLNKMTDKELIDFNNILDQNDHDIYNWITNKSLPNINLESDIIFKIQQFAQKIHKN
ncbi:MAG: succinate dehydrogenase assembly factor 2 [Rickettsiaceae bacterium]